MANLYSDPAHNADVVRQWFETAKAAGADYLAIADEPYDYLVREYTPCPITVEKDLVDGQEIGRDLFGIVCAPVHSVLDLSQSFDTQFQRSKGRPWSIPADDALERANA